MYKHRKLLSVLRSAYASQNHDDIDPHLGVISVCLGVLSRRPSPILHTYIRLTAIIIFYENHSN